METKNHHFQPYEGSEPYLFISYAHKNSDQVLPLVRQVADRGYRIWYDKGIDPGTEFWPQNIGEHLAGCSFVMLFVSQEAMEPHNVLREITFAQNRKIPTMTIFLRETVLPIGVELQLSAAQHTYYYKYKDDEAFFTELLASKLFQQVKTEQTNVFDSAVTEAIAEALHAFRHNGLDEDRVERDPAPARDVLPDAKKDLALKKAKRIVATLRETGYDFYEITLPYPSIRFLKASENEEIAQMVDIDSLLKTLHTKGYMVCEQDMVHTMDNLLTMRHPETRDQNDPFYSSPRAADVFESCLHEALLKIEDEVILTYIRNNAEDMHVINACKEKIHRNQLVKGVSVHLENGAFQLPESIRSALLQCGGEVFMAPGDDAICLNTPDQWDLLQDFIKSRRPAEKMACADYFMSNMKRFDVQSIDRVEIPAPLLAQMRWRSNEEVVVLSQKGIITVKKKYAGRTPGS